MSAACIRGPSFLSKIHMLRQCIDCGREWKRAYQKTAASTALHTGSVVRNSSYKPLEPRDVRAFNGNSRVPLKRLGVI